MNADEIQALPDADLDAVIWATLAPWPSGFLKGDFVFCDSLDHCHVAEERLKEMGLATAFTVQLYLVAVEAQKADSRRHPVRWYEVHASARERAEAILAAVQKQ